MRTERTTFPELTGKHYEHNKRRTTHKSVLTHLSITHMDDAQLQSGCWDAAQSCKWRWSSRPDSPAGSCRCTCARSEASERSGAGGTIYTKDESEGDRGNNSPESWRNRLAREGARYRAWAAGTGALEKRTGADSRWCCWTGFASKRALVAGSRNRRN